MPKTEKRDKVHTSTVTVAILREPSPVEVVISDRDLEWSTCRGSGAGGQHRNKTESAVIVKHRPSGLTIRCESERSQHQNRATALGLLRARLLLQQEESSVSAHNATRKRQVGSGQRGDKTRTVQIQNGVVVDHGTGRRAEAKEYLRIGLDALK